MSELLLSVSNEVRSASECRCRRPEVCAGTLKREK